MHAGAQISKAAGQGASQSGLTAGPGQVFLAAKVAHPWLPSPAEPLAALHAEQDGGDAHQRPASLLLVRLGYRL